MEAALRSLIDWYERAGVGVPPLTPMKVGKTTRAATSRKNAGSPASSQNVNAPNAAQSPNENSGENSGAKPDDAALINAALINAALINAAKQAAQSAKTLDELYAAIKAFDAGRLSDNARGAVIARGNAAANLMVIGEAPSQEDDMKAQPFMGREGALLGRMLGAIGLAEDAFYLTLSVNWRLPQGRAPKPNEIDICRPFLLRHIELAAPSHILMLGSTPMSALCNMTGIMKHHGQWQNLKIDNEDIPALPIYHPSLLLTQPDLKKDAWRDLLTLRAALTT